MNVAQVWTVLCERPLGTIVKVGDLYAESEFNNLRRDLYRHKKLFVDVGGPAHSLVCKHDPLGFTGSFWLRESDRQDYIIEIIEPDA